MTTLPGRPPARVKECLSALSPRAREAFLEHLVGGTSAEWLAGWLKRAGHPVSATTLKVYRRTFNQNEVS